MHKKHEQKNTNKKKIISHSDNQGKKVFLSCSVNESWDELNQEIDEMNVLNHDAVLVADAEPELKNNLANGKRKYQL